jgi:hypothetical protein
LVVDHVRMMAAKDAVIAQGSCQVHLARWLLLRAEVAPPVRLVVCLVQMVRATCLPAVRVVSVLLLVAYDSVCSLGRPKPVLQLLREPLNSLQLMVADFPLRERQRQLAVERSWDFQS